MLSTIHRTMNMLGIRRTMMIGAVVGLVTLTACGGEETGGTAEKSAAKPNTTAVDRASGEPVRIGFINMDNTSLASFPEMRASVEAAAKYVNEELGGADGHPIKVEACPTQASPESSVKCANELIAKKPVAVTAGFDIGGQLSVPILEKANIPYFNSVPVSPAEWTLPNTYQATGGSISAFPAMGTFMGSKLKVKKVRILYAAVDQGLTGAKAVAAPLKAAGVTDVKLIGADPAAADWTTFVSAATKDRPDALIGIVISQLCNRVMSAAKSIGSTAKLFLPGACEDSKILDEAGAAAEGVYFNTPFTPWSDESDKDVKLYRDKLAQYGGGGEPQYSSFSQHAFSTIMNFKAIVEKVGFEKLTPKSFGDAVAETQDEPNFMSHPYTCKGTMVETLPGFCNLNDNITQFQDGKLKLVSDGYIDSAPAASAG